MSIDYFQRIAFRLAGSVLAVALIAGFLGACLLVLLDWRAERAELGSVAAEVYRINQLPLSIALQSNDGLQAQRILESLQHTELWRMARLAGPNGDNVADYLSREARAGNEPWYATWLPELPVYRFDVRAGSAYLGELSLQVSYRGAMEPFLQRSLIVFVAGLVWSVILGLVLTLVAHRRVTAPTVDLARQIAAINTNSPHEQWIVSSPGHERDELGHIVRATNEFIAAMVNKQQSLLERERQIHLILDVSPNHVFAVDEKNRLLFLNHELAEFYGSSVDALAGLDYVELHSRVDSQQSALIANELYSVRAGGHRMVFQKDSLTDAAGQDHVMQISRTPFVYDGKPSVLTVASDITELARAEAGVERMAYYDTLTGLPNRNLVLDRLDMDLRRCRRNGTYGVLMFIDVDDFKRVNDTMNHASGDNMLAIIAERMQEVIRETDTLARLGGDEFTLSAPDLGQDRASAEKAASILARRLINKVSEPISLGRQEFTLGISLGMVAYPEAGQDPNDMLRFADTAMYRAKHQGKNRAVFFAAEMAREDSRLVQLESELRRALRNREFCFYLQPLIHGRNRRLAGAEALLRWRHPERGLLAPDSFMSFLESSNLMVEVGRHLVETACEFVSDTRQFWGQGGPRLALNFTAQEFFQPDFVPFVSRSLSRFQLSGSCFEFEITEGAALHNIDEAVQKIRALKSLGISFALDDFGTGYSSLNYLKQLPVDTMKIDKSFIQDITVNQRDAAMVYSLLIIARNTGMRVVAEGVELNDQARWLTQYENIVYQGYLFSEPVPQADFVNRYFPMPQLADPSTVMSMAGKPGLRGNER